MSSHEEQNLVSAKTIFTPHPKLRCELDRGPRMLNYKAGAKQELCWCSPEDGDPALPTDSWTKLRFSSFSSSDSLLGTVAAWARTCWFFPPELISFNKSFEKQKGLLPRFVSIPAPHWDGGAGAGLPQSRGWGRAVAALAVHPVHGGSGGLISCSLPNSSKCRSLFSLFNSPSRRTDSKKG